MMIQAQGFGRRNCRLLAVLCGKFADKRREGPEQCSSSYPFPELISSGRLEVHVLLNPTLDKFGEAQKLLEPNLLYVQGELSGDGERIGSLVWGSVDLSEPQMFSSLIGPSLPTIVYLEIPSGGKTAHALHSKGVPYVIYWKNAFSTYSATHFRQALLSVVQSSCSHIWDAFQLAKASFQLYCVRNNYVLPADGPKVNGKLGPRLLGDAPKINIAPPEKVMGEGEEEENSSDGLPAIQIYSDDVDMSFLVCGVPCTLDACLLSSLEDGLNALLNIEIRGSKLQNRVSAAPPPLQAGALSRGVVTMRCDITTSSSAHISLLVSGSAQTCFDDQLLECHIKNELIEKSHLVHALSSHGQRHPNLYEPLRSISIACGASVLEVWMKLPSWAAQVLKNLAREVSYRSLVALGIASVQGIPVASFEKEDAERLLFFCNGQDSGFHIPADLLSRMPTWSSSFTRKRSAPNPETKPIITNNTTSKKRLRFGKDYQALKREGELVTCRLKIDAIRPIPHSRQKILPFLAVHETDTRDEIKAKPSHMIVQSSKTASVTHRKSTSSSAHPQPLISVNPLPLKKHECNRAPIQICSEEEFLKDVMEFLILRGHSRLVPQGGIAEFPDAILNAKRLDLFNLYREVVSRGGFYVGNGINWKGQVFSKMRNHTATNRMTGVGNTLKRHYETYLLEYELAHDDVDGECCLLCHSSAPGDWVNCGLCGEWAHFGCDRRQGLASFKDYAKTDGLEYICPQCSLTNFKKKSQKVANGYSNTSILSRTV
ncbi:AT-rich interactive domain-containing protein 4-like [Ananas comosus]|uniref:AT-rich interactive domain-containing protein 4-like n=2 Tax=Ananas comosus TaxID=4615 RepID=A0A6P5GDP3_ANACO|nr:AT-rich interactive domain-containing protein 4-like [Ananas comosus]